MMEISSNKNINNIYENQSFLDCDKYSNFLFNNGKSRPLMLSCETINVCNNKCIICTNNVENYNKHIMSMNLFEKILGDYSDLGGGELSLTPRTGEILLDSFLIDRIKLINKYKLITGVSFTTNATLAMKYNDDVLDFIVNSLEVMHISVYGLNEKEHSLLTSRNTYLDMIEAIKKIIKLSNEKKRLFLGFRSLEYYDDFDISSWMKNNLGVELPYGKTHNYVKWPAHYKKNVRLPMGGKWLTERNNTSVCFMPLTTPIIHSDGSLYWCPCGAGFGDQQHYLGNLKHDSLTRLYNSNKIKKLWDEREDIPNVCKRCAYHCSIDEIGKCLFIFDNPKHFVVA